MEDAAIAEKGRQQASSLGDQKTRLVLHCAGLVVGTFKWSCSTTCQRPYVIPNPAVGAYPRVWRCCGTLGSALLE